jgi:Na+/proline symporter
MSAGRPPESPPPMTSRVRTPLIIAGILLGIAIVVPLLVPTYARDEPRLFDFPFFYWYQLVWVFICAALVSGAHRLVKQHEERKREELGLGRHRDTTGGDR